MLKHVWDSHDLDKMVIRPSHFYHGETYIGKTTLLHSEPTGGGTKASFVNFTSSQMLQVRPQAFNVITQ